MSEYRAVIDDSWPDGRIEIEVVAGSAHLTVVEGRPFKDGPDPRCPLCTEEPWRSTKKVNLNRARLEGLIAALQATLAIVHVTEDECASADARLGSDAA